MKEVPVERSLVIVVAGPNGAGKTTFYETQLADLGFPFVNADNIARQFDLAPYDAAAAADEIRRELMRERRSFVFETVFSDPVGDKIEFLRSLESSGFEVVLCFIGVSGSDISEQRVAMRVSKGGHDVPQQKLRERYMRTLANLKLALTVLGDVRVFDNDDLGHPYQLVARSEGELVVFRGEQLPEWLKGLLPH